MELLIACPGVLVAEEMRQYKAGRSSSPIIYGQMSKGRFKTDLCRWTWVWGGLL